LEFVAPDTEKYQVWQHVEDVIGEGGDGIELEVEAF